MSLRRFEARSTPDALRAVRAALGPDAIILSNRELDDRVEIIATGVIDEALLAMASDVPIEVVAPAADAAPTPEAVAPIERDAPASAHADAVEEPPAPAASAAADPAPDAPGMEGVEARLRRLEVGLWGRHDAARAGLLSKLLALGLGPSLALRLAERATGATDEALVRDAFATLKSSLPTVRDTTLERPGATLVAGPEAESRLDVILKFATQQIAAGGTRSLVLVSADPSRAGAFEVLEAAGRELGVATVRARDAGDLGRTLDGFSDRPLTLVDCGRVLPVGDVPLHVAKVPRRLVVLPATLQRVVAQRTARDARAHGAHGCVLTRLDGAARLGEVLDALVREFLPVAWWSDRDAAHVPLQRAEASVIVATAVSMARRLGTGDDDVALATLMQPAELRAPRGFARGVSLDAGTPGVGASAADTSAAGTPVPGRSAAVTPFAGTGA